MSKSAHVVRTMEELDVLAFGGIKERLEAGNTFRLSKSGLNAARGKGKNVGICKVENRGYGTCRSRVVETYGRTDSAVLDELGGL